jgi:hypothetical protein
LREERVDMFVYQTRKFRPDTAAAGWRSIQLY